MLLDTVALLRDEGRQVSCRIIGDGPERDDLRRQAEVLGITDAVEFRHDVREQKEVYQLLKASRVFVFPSAREGFGIAVLEALACGLPVVTTSDPDNLAQHLAARSANGIICEPTPAAIADAVRPLLARPASPADRPAHDGDPWLGDYNWDAMVDLVISALQIPVTSGGRRDASIAPPGPSSAR
jgi:glycosyltransferase involved in cell wall biosynthesis